MCGTPLKVRGGRWLAVVVVLSLSVVLARAVSQPPPPRDVLPLLESFAVDVAVAFFVPWVLLGGAVKTASLGSGRIGLRPADGDGPPCDDRMAAPCA
jgi:hypothetical protein